MSTLRVGTIANAAGSQSTSAENVINGSAKAWVNFNGTGTVAIRGSYNVTSITDNGVGDYTVNFTTALTDANYAVAGVARRISGDAFFNVMMENNSRTKTSSAAQIITKVSNGTLEDSAENCVAIFR